MTNFCRGGSRAARDAHERPLQYYMHRALELAHQAQAQGEVPVGAVLVRNDEIIGEGFNQPIKSCDPTAHAEIIALRNAAAKCGNYRLPATTLYVTLEPCAMCAAALVHARVQTLVFGAADPKSAGHTVLESALSEKLNHRVECQGGVLAEECTALLKNFFKAKRDAVHVPFDDQQSGATI